MSTPASQSDSEPTWLRAAREQIRHVEAEPLPDSIYALLRETAATIPDTTAIHIIATGQTITYRALLGAVDHLASGLRAIGVRRGLHVGVMLPNRLEMPLTWLALGRIGAVMVPLNVRYTGREMHYTLVDSDATHLVIDHEFLPALAAMPASIPALDGAVVVVGGSQPGAHDWQTLVTDFAPAPQELPPPGLDDLMNIQYTSGTTGLPKGCMLTQRYWLTCGKAYSACDGKSYRHILAGNPFFYMTPQWLLIMAFFQRATLHVAPYRSLTQYTAWVRDNQIDFCLFPFDLLAQTAPSPADRVDRLIRGNIYIHRKDQHADLERRFGFPARTAFGMTEIGMGTFTPLDGAAMTGSGSCGMAGPFRQCRIADLDGNTLPPDQAGELLFRGPGMLQGYYRKPEATAAAFHGDWFRTGDLAVQDGRGFITIVGRIKEMIRRAGENISAAEVESVLLGLPAVAEAAAIPVPDERRGEEVKAVLVLREGVTPNDLPPDHIIRHCETQLASFKVPRFIEYRTAPLPRSTSGKVQKPTLLAEKPDHRAGSWDRLTDARR
jgi:crotonobetaine/carnitine-CoA ligase